MARLTDDEINIFTKARNICNEHDPVDLGLEAYSAACVRVGLNDIIQVHQLPEHLWTRGQF